MTSLFDLNLKYGKCKLEMIGSELLLYLIIIVKCLFYHFAFFCVIIDKAFCYSKVHTDKLFELKLICCMFAVAYPLDLVRRRMQLEGAGGRARVYKTGVFGTFRHIIRTEGWRRLYRGILPEYYKVVPSVGIVFMTYEKLKQVLSDIN